MIDQKYICIKWNTMKKYGYVKSNLNSLIYPYIRTDSYSQIHDQVDMVYCLLASKIVRRGMRGSIRVANLFIGIIPTL